MKPTAVCLLTLTCFACSSTEKAPADPAVVELISKLPNADRLPRAPQAWGHGSGLDSIDKEKISTYAHRVAELNPLYAELKKHLKVGASVFDYPGLITKGNLLHDPLTGRYEWKLTFYDDYFLFSEAEDFLPYVIIFDSSGTILDVRCVVYVS